MLRLSLIGALLLLLTPAAALGAQLRDKRSTDNLQIHRFRTRGGIPAALIRLPGKVATTFEQKSGLTAGYLYLEGRTKVRLTKGWMRLLGPKGENIRHYRRITTQRGFLEQVDKLGEPL